MVLAACLNSVTQTVFKEGFVRNVLDVTGTKWLYIQQPAHSTELPEDLPQSYQI